MNADTMIADSLVGCQHCEADRAENGLGNRAETPSLSLLGGWRLELNGHPQDVQRSVQRLLAFVALRRRSSRDVVAGQLWPDCPEARAHGNLRSTLWRTHMIKSDLITEHSGALSIGPEVEVDVTRLIHTARWLIDAGSGGPADARGRPHELLVRDLLPGWYDDWLLIERERLRQLQLHALEGLAHSLVDLARYSEAVDVALAAIAAEPVRESAHRIVIDVHLAEGNFGEARRAYELFRRLLAVELGVEPSQDLAARVAVPRQRNGAR
jgi:DNA-binding SARP family transcriptional activator